MDSFFLLKSGYQKLSKDNFKPNV